VLPEPRIYTLKKYKMVNGLVSNKIYDYGDSMVSGDHCNYPKPVQTYELVIEKPEDYMVNYLDMLKEYSDPSNKTDSSELRRRMDTLKQKNIEEYGTDDSDLIRDYNRLLQSSEEEERPVVRRLFDSDSTSSDSNSDESFMGHLLEIYYGHRSGDLSQRQREMVENFLTSLNNELEQQPDEDLY